MGLWIITFAAVISALLVHALAWFTRLRYLRIAVVIGAAAATGLVLASGLFLYLFNRFPASGADGAYVIQSLFIIIWAFVLLFALLIGTLQARSLPAPWWKGVLAACFEAGLAFLFLVAVNYTMQWFGPQFERLLQETVGSLLNRFISTFALSLLVLAVNRPVVRLYRLGTHSPPTGAGKPPRASFRDM